MKRKLSVLFIILTFTFFIFSINNKYNKIITEPQFFSDLSLSPELEWWEQWDNGDGDMAFDIAIDSEDYIYIVGDTDVGNVYDIILLKYNSTGFLLWNKTWDGYDYERPYAITLDTFGNIYVTGKSGPSASLYDVFLVKFNEEGQEQWARYWGGPDLDHGYDVALDSEGNIYVAGLYTSLTSKDMCLLKYDNAGNYQWNRTLGDVNQADYGYGLSIDNKTDDIYLVGQLSNGNGDVFLSRYNKQGIQQWNTSWGSGVNPQAAHDVVFYSNSSIYVAGEDAGDSLLMKYNNSGDLQWYKTWGEQAAKSLVVDKYENSYISGYSGLLKYNSSGDQQWEKIWSHSSGATGEGIALDSAGYIYLTGWVSGDIFLLKYNQYVFTLISDPEEISGTGSFKLNWTRSDDAENYSVYFHINPITEINSSVTKLGDNITECYFNVTGLTDGNYYYKVVAYNEYGNYSSNCIKVIVDLLLPIITILSPTPNQLCGINTPGFSLVIDEPNLQETWYSFDNGDNITFTTENDFYSSEWSKVGNGSVLITFYAEDRVNHISSAEVTVRKDANVPEITIYYPSENEIFGPVA
ncbi:MAG: SBBP repeat-containing protein, partial [Candidatus Hodarchaeales archaeon]